MKHRFTRLFSLLMIAAMSMGAMAGSVSDLVAISSDWTFIADGITSNGTVKPTANTLYSDDHIFAPTANTVATNKGNSTFGGNEHLNSLRIKNAQDRLAFKVSGACIVTFYTQSHSSRGLYVSKTDNVTADEAAYAKQSVSTTVWEVELDEAGVYYLTSYGGDFFIAGFVVVFPEEVTCAAPVIAFGSWSDAENGYPVTITNNETDATLTYAIGDGAYQTYSTSFYVGSEVVVHAKASKTGYQDKEVSATAPFHGYADATFAWAIGNESSATITSDKDTYVSQTKVTVGDSLTVGTKSNYDANNGNTMVTYVPASSNSGSVTKVMIEYSIQMLKGMMFKLKSVAYDAIKDGTDNATYSWSYTVDDVESSITTVSKEDLLRNNNTSGTPALRHEETINADAGQNVTVRFYVSGFGNTKKFALSNIVIVGTISDESSSEDPTPACSAPAAPAISGTTSYTADGTISLTATCASGADASTTYTWYKGADWATASAADPVQSATTGSSGYTFTKTAVVADAGTYWCEASNGSGCEAHNTTGYAITVTAGQQYTITYNANEGIGSMSNTTGSGSVTLQKNSYTKDGYVFIGWATSSDNAAAGTVAYLDGASYTLSADAELFAVWSPESYSFTPATSGDKPAVNETINSSTGGTMKYTPKDDAAGLISYESQGLFFQSGSKCIVTITLQEAIQEGTVFTAVLANGGITSAGRGIKLNINSTDRITWSWDPAGANEEKTFQWTVPAEDDAIGKKEFKLIRVANVYLKSLTVTNTAESTPEDPTPEDPTPEDPSGDDPETPADQLKVFGITRTVAAETSTSSDDKVTAKRVSDDILVDPSVAGVTITKSYGLQSVMTDKSRAIKWFDGTTQQDCYVNVGDKNYRTQFEKGKVPESAAAAISITSLDERCYFSFELEVDESHVVSLQALNSDVLKEMYSTHYQVKIYNNGELLKTLEDVGSEYTNSDMKRRFDLSEEAALQDINGTITFKMFVWNTEATKYVNIKDFTVEAIVKQAYARTHSHMNLNTLCYPYQIDTYTGATFYTMLYKVEEASVVTEVVLQEHDGALEAGKPYFYIPEGTKLVCEFSGARENTPAKVNGVQGSYTANTDVPLGSYVTYQGEFRKVGANVKLGEYRAYVDMDAVALEDAVAPAPGRRILRVRNADAPKITTDVESIQQSAISSQKVLRNGQLFIIRDGKTYNAQGQLVK